MSDLNYIKIVDNFVGIINDYKDSNTVLTNEVLIPLVEKFTTGYFELGNIKSKRISELVGILSLKLNENPINGNSILEILSQLRLILEEKRD